MIYYIRDDFSKQQKEHKMDENKDLEKVTAGKQEVLKVMFNHDKNVYEVSSCEGSSIAEMAFGISVVIRVLQRDGYIEQQKDFIELVQKYLDDEQWGEVKS